MPPETIYLVDATSICYRSFFAIKLSNSKGFPTGAIFGFYQTLKKIISKYKPGYMGICFDVGRKTFRHEKFKDYKIQRPPLPDNLKMQIPLIKKMVELLGLSLLEKEGFEADDIIASLVAKALKNNASGVIISSDKDMYQLLNDKHISVYDDSKEQLFNEAAFEKEFGFAPKNIIDYLALTGDSVDNIPGAKGIGKVGATELIKEFSTIENIFNNLDRVKPKLREILIKEKENIFLSKELVTLNPYELDLDWADLKVKERQNNEIYKLFQELEFRSLLKEVAPEALNVQIDLKEEVPAAVAKKINNGECIFFTSGNLAYIFDVAAPCVYKMEISSAKEIFADRQLKKISHDFKGQLSALNTPINAILFDTKIAAYLVDSSLPDYSLATLVSRYLGDFTLQVPAETTPYFINKLYRKFHQLLLENKLEELFYNVEMPLAYILYEMQNWGVSIDVCVMQKLSGDVETKLKSLKNEIFKISGKEFNLNSPKQLGVVLFEELKIKPLKKTKTGYSTAEDVLEKLSAKYEIAKLIIEYRELNKLQTTYINPFIEQVQRQGGKLHAEFNQTATSTGRLSSSSPNLQSIPAKGVFSFQLRKAFVPSFAHGFIVSADYSQIELRILAHFSKDERLKEAFSKNLDIHRYTAALLFAVKEEHVSEEQRNIAKRINFSIIYGMSSYGLSQELGIGNEEAEIFIQDYFSRYPGVKAYINSVYKEIEEKGFVTTILGRRRYLPDFRNPNPQLREFAQRQAVNSPIQGSCADLIKLAMVRIYREFTEKKMSSKLIMQIHDELVFDVQPDELDKLKEIVKRNMEQSIKLNVPIEVKIKVGKNWAQVA